MFDLETRTFLSVLVDTVSRDGGSRQAHVHQLAVGKYRPLCLEVVKKIPNHCLSSWAAGQRQHSTHSCASAGSAVGVPQDSLMVMRLICSS